MISKVTTQFWLALLVGACFMTAGANASAQQPSHDSNAMLAATNGAAPLPPVSVASDTYSIGPEDVLSISVWRQPDLSAPTVPVRPDGKISLPLLNDVQAANMTPMGLAAAITEKLKKYVSDPQVTVVVTAINSKRVYVLGEVTRAGAFPLVPNMTILQALSSAGGFQQYANTKKIYILRKDADGKSHKIAFDYKRAVQGTQTDGDIPLVPGDTIVVP